MGAMELGVDEWKPRRRAGRQAQQRKNESNDHYFSWLVIPLLSCHFWRMVFLSGGQSKKKG